MLNKGKKEVTVSAESNEWTCCYQREKINGPELFINSKEPVISNILSYVDEIKDVNSQLISSKGYKKSGVDIAEYETVLSQNPEIKIHHTYRHALNHIRCVSDVKFAKKASVKRHFGLGCMQLNGKWKRYYCLPPADDIAKGFMGKWHNIPEFAQLAERKPRNNNDLKDIPSIMIGHWHRPPLALIFERCDGLLFKLGVGDDIWRWENNLGAYPEFASYKIILEYNSIKIIREPLMTCEAFVPQTRTYRFSWYMAWKLPEKIVPQSYENIAEFNINNGVLDEFIVSENELSTTKVVIDCSNEALDKNLYRSSSSFDYIRAIKSNSLCWQHNGTQKRYRTLIRQLKRFENIKSIGFKNLTSGICYDPSHVDRKKENGLIHNDSMAILSFIAWCKNHLSDDIEIYIINKKSECDMFIC